MTWEIGQHVQVSLPYGTDDVSVHNATVSRVQEPGPQHPQCTVKVLFEDPLMYGGLGYAWVNPKVLSLPGEDPKRPTHDDMGVVIG